eukprot:1014128-Rhodomonas_salina.1
MGRGCAWGDAFGALGDDDVDAARADVGLGHVQAPDWDARGHSLDAHLVRVALPAPRHVPAHPPTHRTQRAFCRLSACAVS